MSELEYCEVYAVQYAERNDRARGEAMRTWQAVTAAA